MSNEEIIEEIKSKIEDYTFQVEINAYIQGYLDALCKTYEITWEQRYEIVSALE